MSEGDYVIVRPHKPVKNGPKDIDESTDTYDTIDWLVKNVPGNTGKVGMWGISQPGFYATAGMIDAHPALVAVSPQAPVTDYYMGDDVYHNGAFMLAHRFGFYMGFRRARASRRRRRPRCRSITALPTATSSSSTWARSPTPRRSTSSTSSRIWTLNVDHTTYDEVWQSRAIWKYLKGIKPAVMLVGGWYDTEDPQGLLRQFDFMEKNTPPAADMLVMGRGTTAASRAAMATALGNVNFGSKTAQYYRENIEFPFFLYYLKGRGDGKFPKAWMFQTGMNQWRRFDAWPPQQAKPQTMLPRRRRASSPGSSRPSRASTNTCRTRTSPCPTSAYISAGRPPTIT